MAPLPPHKATFLQSCLTAHALSFGTFTLKSGRISPYFFNAGLFHNALLLRSLSQAYAHTLAAPLPADTGSTTSAVGGEKAGEEGKEGKPLDFDILFGPAYKGIPLAATVTSDLASLSPNTYGHISYSFNRKEAKTHGEGGSIVGAPLAGKRIVIIDDVITAGTAIREAISIIEAQGGELVGIIVAFDRMERTPTREGEVDRGMSAIGEVRREYGVPVLSILDLEDVLVWLRGSGTKEEVNRLKEYRERYRAVE